MSLTSKGRKWEILHSLWIGWTFTLGFFNWVGFLYAGIRVRRRRWILYAAIYFIPFLLAMVFAGSPAFDKGWIGDVTVALTLILGVISIFHAFKIRREYLLRLSAWQEEAARRNEAFKNRIESRHMRGDTSEAVKTQSTEPGKNIPDKPTLEREGSSAPAVSEPLHVEPEELEIVGSGHNLEEYPLPLAFGYSVLMSKWDPWDRYREQLRFAENMLAFVASVSLALLEDQGSLRSEIAPEEYWRGGISPGDWKDIISCCSKVFATRRDQPLASSIKGLNIRSEKKGFGRDIAELIREKNDYKHDRGPTVEEDVVIASSRVQEKIDRCMDSLSFFTRYPIRLIQDFDLNRNDMKFTLKCLRYTGDGPGFPQEKIAFPRALPKGDLFIDLGERNWVSLYPFITTRNCPRCKSREVYFIDRWDEKRNLVQLKSFERGHTEESTEISAALKEWKDHRSVGS